MNNDRGKSLQIPQSTLLKEGSIYVATLHSVYEKNFSGDIKHQFTYEVELNQETHYVNRNITVKSMCHQLSIADWIKRHSNYNVNHINYDPYIDRKHLVLVGQYNGNYYIQDVAPLDEFGGYCNESYFRNVNKIIKSMEAIDRKGLIAILTSSIGNDEMDDSEQAVMVYNELIDKLQLNILKMSTIDLTYTVILVFKKPNDTILVEMMICIFHIKRFDSELFVFKDKGWQKVSEDELQGLISKMIQVLLVDYKPSLSTLKT